MVGGGGGSIVLDKGYSRDEKGKLLASCPNHLDVLPGYIFSSECINWYSCAEVTFQQFLS